MSLLSKISYHATNGFIFTSDTILALVNALVPDIKEGHVIPEGHPGFGGKWPEYIPPQDGDSRCSCPALNAMANHGVINRDGKNITFVDLNHRIRTMYNFSPTFCRYVPGFAANYLNKSYAHDTFDLHELDLHNTGIEHDASLTREDYYFVQDQGTPSQPLIDDLLSHATGKTKDGDEQLLLPADLSRYSAKRRAISRRTNPTFQLDEFHKMFGSSNSSTMLVIFGGRINDLRTFLKEERIPDGWEPRLRSRFGLTFAAFNMTVLKVERGIDEAKYLKEEAAEAEAEAQAQQEAASTTKAANGDGAAEVNGETAAVSA